MSIGQRIALRDPENVVLAMLEVQSIWQPDKSREAVKVFGADDPAHPAVRYLHDKAGSALCRRPRDRPAGAGAL